MNMLKRLDYMGKMTNWLGCLALVLLAVGCGDKEGSADEQKAPQVKTFPLVQQQVTDTGEWFGYLRGKQDTDVHPHVTGFLMSQEYENGSFVQEGDVLFRIDPATYEAELALAEANLGAAEASLASANASREQALRDVQRYKQLVGNGAVSEKDLDDAEHRLRAADAAVRAASAVVEQNKAAVDRAKINLDYTVIRAPYAGIIGTAQASRGDLVTSATKLANITSVDPIRLEFAINSDRLIAAFRKYGDINNRELSKLPPPPPVDIVLEDGSVFPEKGRLLAMESKVSESGLINVEGEVPNPDSLLRGGMPVRVRIPLDKKEALLVPQAAIRSVLRSDFIIVVDPQQVPHMVPVVVQGQYKVEVPEADGYHSTQTLVAVEGYKTPLQDTLRSYGYEQPTQAPVVVDEQNGVLAMNISSANSRLAPNSRQPLGTVSPVPFSFRPAVQPAVAAAAAAGAGNTAPEVNKNARPTEPEYPVKVANLLQQDVAVMDEWFGSLRGVEETDIRPQVTGFVQQQHFKDGSLVKKGDVLFTIDPAPFEAALAEAQANLHVAQAAVQQAEAELDRSTSDYARYERLNASTPGAISDKTLTDARSTIKTNEAALLKAKASVAQTQAALSLAEINLSYTTIRAPFDGRVGIHKPSVGALVSPADAQPLVTLSSIDPIRVDFQVSGKGALQGIAAFSGEREQDMPGFDIVLEDGSTYPVQGHVVSVDNALSRSTGTLQVVGQVQNVDGGLRSGMPVRVRAGLTPQKGAFLVPARAPMNAQGRDLVILLRADGTPEMLPITKGNLVNVKVAYAEGQEPVLQPMQVIDVDRNLVGSMVLAFAQAPSLESLVLQGAEVSDWKGFALKVAQVADSRALVEKLAGKPLPDNAPAEAGLPGWDELALRRAGVDDFRSLAFHLAGAADELDLIARAQGHSSVMQMVLQRMGFEDMSQVPVVVEGSLRAAQVYAANKKAGAPVNKVKPSPFNYVAPRTVVGSVTAEDPEPTQQHMPEAAEQAK